MYSIIERQQPIYMENVQKHTRVHRQPHRKLLECLHLHWKQSNDLKIAFKFEMLIWIDSFLYQSQFNMARYATSMCFNIETKLVVR